MHVFPKSINAEKQIASFWIWTRVGESTFYDDNRYVTITHCVAGVHKDKITFDIS